MIMSLMIGAGVGALGGLMMQETTGFVMNIVVGIIGAALGGLAFTGGDIVNSPLTVGDFAVPLLDAIIALAVFNLIKAIRSLRADRFR